MRFQWDRKATNPQGITASGNVLYRIIALSLLIILIPVLLGFSYLLIVRDPGLQNVQIGRVSSTYATQQAVNIQQLISRLADRIQGAAKSPLALSAIGDDSSANVALIEQTMLDYFPEVISLRILPIGELGTAGFTSVRWTRRRSRT